jgi:hypothetical protein
MSGRFHFRPACDSDCGALDALVRATPQPGQITLGFERHPDFFMGSRVTTSEPDVWVMEDLQQQRLMAVFSIGHRRVFMNGQPRNVRYGNDLRIHPDYQGGRTLLRISRHYHTLIRNDWMQTVILSDNDRSLTTVGSGRAGLPTYHACGGLRTHLLYPMCSPRKPKTGNIEVRQATLFDVSAMQDFFDREAARYQFYPCYDFDRIAQGDDPYYRGLSLSDYALAFRQGELVGILGSWNQKSFRQTRFIRYQGSLRFLRHLNNLQVRLRGGMALPAAGKVLNYRMLHSVLIQNEDPAIFECLVHYLYQRHASRSLKPAETSALVCGLAEDSGLNRVLDQYRSQVIESRHFLVSFEADPREALAGEFPLYLEAARL